MHFNRAQNMIFLTGANMAGKSTLMKALGAVVYLAHMGFPVAAEEMQFTVMDGLFTSINVPDNLNKGYSHFYAEVLRVKTVATQVSEGRRLLVIFDELFKGTNVKDAFDATLAVAEAFAAYRNCFYIVSTHIIEVGEELGKRGEHILFRYMPTQISAGVPCYTYRMTEGISNDRQGMMIIEKEGIPAMLQAIVKDNASG
jgi:DNA mismatch repair ATPase MutS